MSVGRIRASGRSDHRADLPPVDEIIAATRMCPIKCTAQMGNPWWRPPSQGRRRVGAKALPRQGAYGLRGWTGYRSWSGARRSKPSLASSGSTRSQRCPPISIALWGQVQEHVARTLCQPHPNSGSHVPRRRGRHAKSFALACC
jgi:hypothetical protein